MQPNIQAFTSNEGISVRTFSDYLDRYPMDAQHKHLLTRLAKECFDEIENERPGAMHYAKKYAIGSSAFVATMGITAAAVLGIGTKFVPPLGALVAATVLGNAVGFKPAKWIFTISTLALLYVSHRVAEASVGSFNREEERFKGFEHNRHAQIIVNLTTSYNKIGEALELELARKKDTPKELYDLKQDVKTLAAHLPYVTTAFKTVGLSNSETFQVLEKVQNVMDRITNAELSVKKDDNEYNIMLLTDLPREFIPSMCIPQKAHDDLVQAEHHHLGITHTIKKFAVSALAVAIPPLVSSAFTSDWLPAVGSGAAGVAVATRSYKSYSAEREKEDTIRAKFLAQAGKNILDTYNGIAKHLQRNKKLTQKIQILSKRLPVIRQEIDKLAIPGYSGQFVTQELEKSLGPNKNNAGLASQVQPA